MGYMKQLSIEINNTCESCNTAPNCNGCKIVVRVRNKEITVNGITREIIKEREIK